MGNCVIAQVAYLNPNTALGDQSVIGANAVSNYNDIPPNSVWFGNPAQPLPVPMQPRKATPFWLLCTHFLYVIIQITTLKSFDMLCFTVFNLVGSIAVKNGLALKYLV